MTSMFHFFLLNFQSLPPSEPLEQARCLKETVEEKAAKWDLQPREKREKRNQKEKIVRIFIYGEVYAVTDWPPPPLKFSGASGVAGFFFL